VISIIIIFIQFQGSAFIQSCSCAYANASHKLRQTLKLSQFARIAPPAPQPCACARPTHSPHNTSRMPRPWEVETCNARLAVNEARALSSVGRLGRREVRGRFARWARLVFLAEERRQMCFPRWLIRWESEILSQEIQWEKRRTRMIGRRLSGAAGYNEWGW
jgi:hypothetical protein